MEDVEAIKQVKARYMRCVDTKDWDGFRNVFTDDVVWDTTRGGSPVVIGGDAVRDYVEKNLGNAVCVHQGGMPEIEVTSETTATGKWSCADVIRWPDGRTLHGYALYEETYEKVDGEWRIKTLVMTPLIHDFTISTSHYG